jgi:multidrug resistance efflux pump
MMDIFRKKEIELLETVIKQKERHLNTAYKNIDIKRESLEAAELKIIELESMINTDSKSIDKLIADELKRANEKFPLFASIREAESVLREEIEELEEEIQKIRSTYQRLWNSVRKDNNDYLSSFVAIKKFTKQAIVEAIQVAAMCDKALMLYKPEKENVNE